MKRVLRFIRNIQNQIEYRRLNRELDNLILSPKKVNKWRKIFRRGVSSQPI